MNGQVYQALMTADPTSCICLAYVHKRWIATHLSMFRNYECRLRANPSELTRGTSETYIGPGSLLALVCGKRTIPEAHIDRAMMRSVRERYWQDRGIQWKDVVKKVEDCKDNAIMMVVRVSEVTTIDKWNRSDQSQPWMERHYNWTNEYVVAWRKKQWKVPKNRNRSMVVIRWEPRDFLTLYPGRKVYEKEDCKGLFRRSPRRMTKQGLIDLQQHAKKCNEHNKLLHVWHLSEIKS